MVPVCVCVMARIYGLLAGVVTGLSVTYATLDRFHQNTRSICRELRHAQDVALDKPKLIRPYTDPINLETRSVRDSVADLWNEEVLRAVRWLQSVKE